MMWCHMHCFLTILLTVLAATTVDTIENWTGTHTVLENRGIIKDRQAKEQCEVFQAISNRNPREFMAMKRPPPADEAVIGCYLKDGVPCFPKDAIEEYSLKSFNNDNHENKEPSHAKTYFCASGTCVPPISGQGYDVCGICNRSLRACVPFQPSGATRRFKGSTHLFRLISTVSILPFLVFA